MARSAARSAPALLPGYKMVFLVLGLVMLARSGNLFGGSKSARTAPATPRYGRSPLDSVL